MKIVFVGAGIFMEHFSLFEFINNPLNKGILQFFDS